MYRLEVKYDLLDDFLFSLTNEVLHQSFLDDLKGKHFVASLEAPELVAAVDEGTELTFRAKFLLLNEHLAQVCFVLVGVIQALKSGVTKDALFLTT